MKNELITRTKKFALDIINLTTTLPYSPASKIITNQLLGAATEADFLYKIKVAEEEANELTAIFSSISIKLKNKRSKTG
jgi:hypothetical protein